MTEEYDELRRAHAKRYLERVKGLRARTDALRAEIDAQRQAMEPKGIRYDRGGGNAVYADAIPDGVARIQGMAATYAEELRDYMDEAAAAHDVLRSLPDPRASAILTRRYILGQSWDEVSGAMGYSRAWAMRLRDAALLDVYERMPHEWRIPREPAL